MAASRRFVIGDIHGCAKTFDQLLFDELAITKEDWVYLLGNYIDIGPSSKQVLDRIRSLKHDNYQVLALRGSSEDQLLKAMANETIHRNWVGAGGDTTLFSFGVNAASLIPEQYIAMINRMGFYVELDHFFLVHAGINFSIDHPLADADAMLYEHVEKYDKLFLRGKRLVHAHTPSSVSHIRSRLESGEAVINIDAGCAYSPNDGMGNLAALDLDTMQLHMVKNCDLVVNS